MLDPTLLKHLARIHQQELIDQAAGKRPEGITLIQWSRLLEPLHAFLQRRSRRSAFQYSSAPQTVPAQLGLEECPCE